MTVTVQKTKWWDNTKETLEDILMKDNKDFLEETFRIANEKESKLFEKEAETFIHKLLDEEASIETLISSIHLKCKQISESKQLVVGVFGQVGAGKSSFMNRTLELEEEELLKRSTCMPNLYSEKEKKYYWEELSRRAEVSANVNTIPNSKQAFTLLDNIKIVDTQGFGIAEMPATTFFRKIDMPKFDLAIYVSKSLDPDGIDTRMFRVIQSFVKTLYVGNKIDLGTDENYDMDVLQAMATYCRKTGFIGCELELMERIKKFGRATTVKDMMEELKNIISISYLDERAKEAIRNTFFTVSRKRTVAGIIKTMGDEALKKSVAERLITSKKEVENEFKVISEDEAKQLRLSILNKIKHETKLERDRFFKLCKEKYLKILLIECKKRHRTAVEKFEDEEKKYKELCSKEISRLFSSVEIERTLKIILGNGETLEKLDKIRTNIYQNMISKLGKFEDSTTVPISIFLDDKEKINQILAKDRIERISRPIDYVKKNIKDSRFIKKLSMIILLGIIKPFFVLTRHLRRRYMDKNKFKLALEKSFENCTKLYFKKAFENYQKTHKLDCIDSTRKIAGLDYEELKEFAETLKDRKEHDIDFKIQRNTSALEIAV